MLRRQEAVRGPLNMFANLMAVCQSIKKRSQDKHVQRAVQQIRPLLHLFLVIEDVRPSMGRMVDVRPWIVKGKAH
jgi:hypothetical protein